MPGELEKFKALAGQFGINTDALLLEITDIVSSQLASQVGDKVAEGLADKIEGKLGTKLAGAIDKLNENYTKVFDSLDGRIDAKLEAYGKTLIGHMQNLMDERGTAAMGGEQHAQAAAGSAPAQNNGVQTAATSPPWFELVKLILEKDTGDPLADLERLASVKDRLQKIFPASSSTSNMPPVEQQLSASRHAFEEGIKIGKAAAMRDVSPKGLAARSRSRSGTLDKEIERLS